MKIRRPSASIVIATIALVLAVSGTAAASGYMITRVGQIKPAVRQALRGNVGPQGPTGPQGPAGAQGTPGLLGLTTVDGPVQSYAPGTYGAAPYATCPPGDVVVGTGFNGPFNAVGGFVKSYGTFVGGFFANNSSISLTGNVQAICAQLPGQTTMWSTTMSARGVSLARSRYASDVERSIALVRDARH